MGAQRQCTLERYGERRNTNAMLIPAGTDMATLTMVKVPLSDGTEEEVYIDPNRGPLIVNMNGTTQVWTTHDSGKVQFIYHFGTNCPWKDYTKTEIEVIIIQVAKKTRALKKRMGWM